MRQQQRI